MKSRLLVQFVAGRSLAPCRWKSTAAAPSYFGGPGDRPLTNLTIGQGNSFGLMDLMNKSF